GGRERAVVTRPLGARFVLHGLGRVRRDRDERELGLRGVGLARFEGSRELDAHVVPARKHAQGAPEESDRALRRAGLARVRGLVLERLLRAVVARVLAEHLERVARADLAVARPVVGGLVERDELGRRRDRARALLAELLREAHVLALELPALRVHVDERR